MKTILFFGMAIWSAKLFRRSYGNGTLSGRSLGQAAHRMVNHSLNMKPNGYPRGPQESYGNPRGPQNSYGNPHPPQQSYGNPHNSYTLINSRPVGPPSNGNGFRQDDYSRGSYNQVLMRNCNIPVYQNNLQGYSPNFKIKERSRDQYGNAGSGMTSFTLEESYYGNSSQPPSQSMPNYGSVKTITQFMTSMTITNPG